MTALRLFPLPYSTDPVVLLLAPGRFHMQQEHLFGVSLEDANHTSLEEAGLSLVGGVVRQMMLQIPEIAAVNLSFRGTNLRHSFVSDVLQPYATLEAVKANRYSLERLRSNTNYLFGIFGFSYTLENGKTHNFRIAE